MRKLSLKRYLFFGILVTFGAAGILAGCGKKEYPQENDESDGQSFSIGDELQWESDFGWRIVM